MVTTVIEGKIEGKLERDKPRTPFIKKFIKYIERNTNKDLKVAVMDKDKWKSIETI